MIAIGFLVVLALVRRDGPRHLGISADTVSEIAFWLLLAGLAGTRIAYIVMFPDQFSITNPLKWFAIWEGGLVFQGALPGGVLYYLYAVRRHKFSFWRGLDCAFPYLPLAHAFGRVGCFLFGCCYGKPAADLPWAVQFPAGSPAWGAGLQDAAHHCTLPLHPTQLYSMLGLLTIFAILMLCRRYFMPFDGFTAGAYMVLYGGFRLFVEFYRADNVIRWWGTFSDQQVFAMLMIAAGVVILLYLWRYGTRTEPVVLAKKDATQDEA
jgi:phosphatidylglycerol:prolipoprotein diacylglycerol transferase